MGLLESLEYAVRRLRWEPDVTEWSDYYDNTNYSHEGLEHKKQLLAGFLDMVKPKTVWDLGANNGIFSRLSAGKGAKTICFDLDPVATEKNYLESKRKEEVNIFPLILDLTNPSPGVGWENMERFSWLERGPVDTVLALAIIHHLAISNNLPLDRIASFFSKICDSLIIEFIPKSDSQVQKLLSARKDIFSEYGQATFERVFKKYFKILDAAAIRDSERTLYLMAGTKGKVS